jgi:hypothetical protein
VPIKTMHCTLVKHGNNASNWNNEGMGYGSIGLVYDGSILNLTNINSLCFGYPALTHSHSHVMPYLRWINICRIVDSYPAGIA